MSETDYARIEQAIGYLDAHFREQPSLAEIAAQVHLSEFHFQRLFKRWAGVTPKRFLQYLTVHYTGELLRNDHKVLEASLRAGLSGPGRLHEQFVNVQAMTPGEAQRRGAGLTIRYGLHPSPFGDCLLARTARGICALRFIDANEAADALSELRREWPAAHWVEDVAGGAGLAAELFEAPYKATDKRIELDLKGTNFQLQVWQALLRIPPGEVIAYQDLAEDLGRPEASRAVAGAVAKNPIAYLIPCHRVIRATGAFSGYRWGVTRKKALLGWEAARRETSATRIDEPVPDIDTAPGSHRE